VSFITNLRQKDFMVWMPWFFLCCVLFGTVQSLESITVSVFVDGGLDFKFWNSPALSAVILACMGMVYWGLISRFSFHNIVFSFSILYGLLALNLALYDFFPAKPAPSIIALFHIVSIAWQIFIPLLIWTGVNRFLDVKQGMRLYPILIVLMGVGYNLGQLPGLLFRIDFDVAPILSVIVMTIIMLWLAAVQQLSKKYSALVQQRELENASAQASVMGHSPVQSPMKTNEDAQAAAAES
jgi:heme/copper-type cytochrome/quinol oxidase subunit 4